MKRTLFFEKNTAFRNDDGDVSIDVALTVLVDEGDCDVGVRYTLPKRHFEDTLSWLFCDGN